MSRRVISAALTLQDQSFSAGLRKANKQAGDFGRGVNVVQNKVESFKKSAANAFKSIGKGAAALGVAGITALGASVAKTVLDMDSSFSKLQAQTGAMGVDLESLKDAAKETFASGYGESLEEVSDAISRVKQNMTGLDNSEISKVTSNALLLAKTMDSDVNEVTRGTNNLMQAFGVSSEKAFDLFTAGGQRGLNFSNEMFDNVAEYAPLFGKMGYSAEEMFGILERGSQKGVYNLDYVNDVMKEFQIRIKDGSKATDETMSVMSKKTFDLWEAMNRGEATVSDVASAVSKELQGMDDQITASQLAVTLFGTKFEDLESDAVYAMLGTTEGMKNFEGATASAAQSVEGSIGNRMKSVWRDLQLSIAGVVNGSGAQGFFDSVATKAEELVPKITNIVEKAIELGNTIKTHWPQIRETIVGITVAVLAFKAGMVAMSIVTTVTGFIKGYRAAVAAGTVAQWAMNTAMAANPIGLVIGLMAGLVAACVLLYRNSDKVRQGWDTAWNGIKSATASSVNFVVEKINDLINLLNKIPGVNIPIVPKVQWGNVAAGSKEIFNAKSSNVNKGPVASYAVGSNRITQDQTADIHKDEMIIPARKAANVRALGGNINNIDSLVRQQAKIVPVSSGQSGNDGKGTVHVVIENITAAGVTVPEVTREIVTQLKLTLANM